MKRQTWTFTGRWVAAVAAGTAVLMMPPTWANQAASHGAAPKATAWTSGSLRQALASLPVGDVARGQKVHDGFFCASCHGEQGVAPTLNWPHLAGQKAAYTAKMMLDYQSALRLEGPRAQLMHDVAVMLNPQQIADVSAYYASLPKPVDAATPRPGAAAWTGVAPADQPQSVKVLKQESKAPEQLVRHGDPARLVTPCASCHGARGQGGLRDAPALAGQNPLYFVRTMLDYQSGVRANDPAKGMRAFAAKLTRTEIEALAAYYADLKGR